VVPMPLSLTKTTFDAIATATTMAFANPKNDPKWIRKQKRLLPTSPTAQIQTFQFNHDC